MAEQRSTFWPREGQGKRMLCRWGFPVEATQTQRVRTDPGSPGANSKERGAEKL